MDALAGQPYGGVFFVDGWPDKVVSIFKDPLGRVVIRHAVHGRTEHQVHEFVGRRAGTYHYKGFTGRATLGKSGCVVKQAVLGEKDGRHLEEERVLGLEALQESQREANA